MSWRLLMIALVACGGEGATVEGSVGGSSLQLAASWWGGPFISLVDQPYECLDMAWVNRYYEEEEPPLDEDMVALQFTFNGDDVVDGLYDVAGEAALTSRFLVIQDGVFTIAKARSGQLIIDEITSKDELIGTFDVAFDAGQLTGTLSTDWCTNLKG